MWKCIGSIQFDMNLKLCRMHNSGIEVMRNAFDNDTRHIKMKNTSTVFFFIFALFPSNFFGISNEILSTYTHTHYAITSFQYHQFNFVKYLQRNQRKKKKVWNSREIPTEFVCVYASASNWWCDQHGVCLAGWHYSV